MLSGPGWATEGYTSVDGRTKWRGGMKPRVQPGPAVVIEQTVRELLDEKVVLDIEGIDRLYLNLYQPMLL